MLYFMIAMAVIATIAAIILFSKIKIFFEYKKLPGEKIYTDLKIKIGFIKIPLRQKKKPKENPDSANGKLLEKLKKYTKAFRTVKRIYQKHRWHIRKNFIVENFDFHIKFGTGDAASTGILTGVIWSFLYGVNGLVSTAGILKKHYFEVAPVYTEKGLILQGSTRISARVASLLILALRIYITYKKITDSAPNGGLSEK